MKRILATMGVYLTLTLCGLADSRDEAIVLINQCIKAVQSGDEPGALSAFAALEKNNPETLASLKKLNLSTNFQHISGVNEKETGTSGANFEGKELLYVFGELAKNDKSNNHFSADLVVEDGTWKIVRLGVAQISTAGSARLSYEKVPQVNNAVNSMIAGEGVLNQFMRAGMKMDVATALKCWVKAEREKPDKADELKTLFTSQPAYFTNFIEVVEGKTDFGFKTAGVAVEGVTADGKMAYQGGDLRGFKATLDREDGVLKIKRLSF